jgi:O-antigen ligase
VRTAPAEVTAGRVQEAGFLAHRPRASGAILDLIGLALAALLAANAVVAKHGDARPIIGVLVVTILALVCGRVLGSLHPAIAPGLVLLVAMGAVLIAGDIGTDGRVEGLLAYSNALGSLFVQVAFAAVMFGAALRWKAPRVVAFIAAAAFGWLASRSSTAAGFTLGLLVVAAPAFIRSRWTRPAVVGSFIVFIAFLATTILLGAAYTEGSGGGLNGAFRTAFTERRIVLWHDALTIMEDHPGGVGPGRFARFSPTARADQDARWAHNEFLQMGAELGWLGFALTLLLFVWGFARLLVHPAPDPIVALGAASLAALGIHSSFDYVLHFAAVPVAAAMILGSAQANRGIRRPRQPINHSDQSP